MSQCVTPRADTVQSAMPAPGCQVIGAGWCRTGTSSLQAALCALGYAPCFHSRLIPYLPELRDACYDYCTGRTRAFPTQHVFRRYRAAVDLPAALIPLLLDAYPDAKARPGSDVLGSRLYRTRWRSLQGLAASSGCKLPSHPLLHRPS